MKKTPLVLGTVLAALLAACSGAPSGPQVVTVTATDLAFEPTTIEVAAGR